MKKAYLVIGDDNKPSDRDPHEATRTSRHEEAMGKLHSKTLSPFFSSFGHSFLRHVDLKIPRVGRQHLGTVAITPNTKTQRRFLLLGGGMAILKLPCTS